MWLQASLGEKDVVELITQLTPVRIDLGSPEEERYLHLGRPSAITLVPEKKAVRVVTRAKLLWSLSVLNVPVTLDSLTVLLKPVIAPAERSDKGKLTFDLELEEADFKHVPAFVDRKITQAINLELASKGLHWDFSETLSHAFELPSVLEPLEKLHLDVAWGEVKVSAEALVFAVSFRPSVTRKHASEAPELE